MYVRHASLQEASIVSRRSGQRGRSYCYLSCKQLMTQTDLRGWERRAKTGLRSPSCRQQVSGKLRTYYFIWDSVPIAGNFLYALFRIPCLLSFSVHELTGMCRQKSSILSTSSTRWSGAHFIDIE